MPALISYQKAVDNERKSTISIFSSQLLKLYIQFIDVYILYVHAQIQQGII